MEVKEKLKIPKQEYAGESKELAVRWARAGQSIGTVARKPSLVKQTLHKWGKAANAGKLSGGSAKRVAPEQMELS